MCVIIYKPTGQKLPTRETLRNCWNRNNDGAGFSFSEKGKIVIDKGYLSFKKLYKALTVDDFTDVDLVVHFRLATHGGVNQQNTHPFPLTSDKQIIHLLDCRADVAISHNGIISGYGTEKGFSDTAEFVLQVLSNFRQSRLRLPEVQKFVQEASRSKFAFHYPDKVYLVGDFKLHEGCFYSNDSYKKRQSASLWRGQYANVDWEDNWSWNTPLNRWEWTDEKTEVSFKRTKSNEPYFRLSDVQTAQCHVFMEETDCSNCRLSYNGAKGTTCLLEGNITNQDVKDYLDLDTSEYYRQLGRGSL